MSQQTLIREKRGDGGGIRYSAQNSLRERNFAYIENPIQLVSFFFFCQSTAKLLNALSSGLSDRSASVRKSYATAIGHLVKVNPHQL